GVEGVLDVRRRVGLIPEALLVGFVLGEEQAGVALAVQPVVAEVEMGGLDDAAGGLAEGGLAIVATPGPGVAEPEGREETQGGGLGSAIVDGNADEDVFGALLGVLDEDVEVAVVREGAGVEQLVLEILAGAAAGGLDEIAVGELALGVLVQVLHVRVGRRAIEIKVVFLAVLAVVPLAVGKAVEALLEDGIALVPQGQGEAEQLAVVADSAES